MATAFTLASLAVHASASGLVDHRSHGPRGSIHGQPVEGTVDHVSHVPKAWNFMILLVDDSNSPMWGAGGLATVPAMDTLRTQGRTYSKVYAAFACSPTRAMFMTMRNQHQTKVISVGNSMDVNELTWMQDLDSSRVPYDVRLYGKLHGVPPSPVDPITPGFDFWYGASGASISDYDTWTASEQTSVENRVTSSITTYSSEELVDRAIADMAVATQPTVYVMSFFNSHSDGAGNFHSDVADPSAGCGLGTNELCQEVMTEKLFTEVGRLMAAVDTANTIVFTMADNGEALDPLVEAGCDNNAKGTLYECGIDVEFTVSYGPIPAGSRNASGLTELLSAADIGRTILDYAGVKNQVSHERAVDGDARYNGQARTYYGQSMREEIDGFCDPTNTYGCTSTHGKTELYSRDTAFRVMTDGTTKYWVAADGTSEFCYTLPDEINTIAASNCDALEAAIAVLDDLPTPSGAGGIDSFPLEFPFQLVWMNPWSQQLQPY